MSPSSPDEPEAVQTSALLPERLLEACRALVGSGVTEDELLAFFDVADQLQDLEGEDADAIVVAAWLLGIPALDLAEFLRSRWSPGAAARVRARFGLVRNALAHRAGTARRALAQKTQPEELRRRVAELKSSGRASSNRHAFKILADELGKTAHYLERRARRAHPDR